MVASLSGPGWAPFTLSKNDHTLRYPLCMMRHFTHLCTIHFAFVLVYTWDVFDDRQADCKSCTRLELWLYAIWMGITMLSCVMEMLLIVLNDSKDAELYSNYVQNWFAHPKTAIANKEILAESQVRYRKSRQLKAQRLPEWLSCYHSEPCYMPWIMIIAVLVLNYIIRLLQRIWSVLTNTSHVVLEEMEAVQAAKTATGSERPAEDSHNSNQNPLHSEQGKQKHAKNAQPT